MVKETEFGNISAINSKTRPEVCSCKEIYNGKLKRSEFITAIIVLFMVTRQCNYLAYFSIKSRDRKFFTDKYSLL